MLEMPASSVAVLGFAVLGMALPASGALVIEDGDTVTPAWTVSGQVTSVSRPDGSGQAGRGLQVNYSAVEGWAGGTISSTSIAGDLSAFRGGTLEFDYRVLGVEVSPGDWQPRADHPRFTSVSLVDSVGRSINYDVQIYSAGLNWDMTTGWHTVSLALPEQISDMSSDAIRTGSLFDGVAGSGASLPTAAAGQNFSGTPGEWDSFWQNIVRIDIHTYYVGQPGTANGALVFDNVTLVPEPAAMGLLGALSVVAMRRRRA